jgi:hypothetical protein
LLKSVGIDNIDVSRISLLLEDNDSKLSQELNLKLAHAHNGHRALEKKDFPQAIREYYLVLEDTNFERKEMYKALRAAVSHHELTVDKTIKNLKLGFGITIAHGEFLDLNNPKIRKILDDEAGKLRDSVCSYLIGQLKNELVKIIAKIHDRIIVLHKKESGGHTCEPT